MRRRKLFGISVVFMSSLILVACNEDSEADEDADAGTTEQMSLATASTGGTFFPLGTGIADIISESSDGIQLNAESTGGSVDNVGLVEMGESDAALVDNNVAVQAYEGLEDFDEHSNLRGMFFGYTQMMHIVVPEDSSIESVEDLEGQTIAIGPQGSGTANTTQDLLESLGIWDSVDTEYISHEETSLALGDGRVDAGTYVLGMPGSSITEFLTSEDGEIIPVETELVEQLQEDNPYYEEVPIPADTYPGQEEEVNSFGAHVPLVVNADVDEDIVYEMTEIIMDNLSELEDSHPVAEEFSFDDALDGMLLPLHEGAERYFQEQEHPDVDEVE